jgi:RNA recognition motif-containing protein
MSSSSSFEIEGEESTTSGFSSLSEDSIEFQVNFRFIFVELSVITVFLQIQRLQEDLNNLQMANEDKRKLLRALKGREEDPPKETFPDPPNSNFKLQDLQFVVEDLDCEIDEDDLKNHFEKFGKVADIEIGWIRRAGKTRQRKALITFLNFHHEFPGRFQRIRDSIIFLGIHKSKREPSSTVVVTGVIEGVNSGTLRQYLSYFGEIVDFRRPVNRTTHRLSQTAFVKFDEPESAQKLLRFNQHQLRDGQRKVPIEVFEFPEL